MKVKHAVRIALNIPFYHERVTRAMHRAQSHDERIHIYRIETDDGVVGYGENDGTSGTSDVESLVGQNLLALINDDSIGIGPQVAALDAVGKSADVPIHALLGTKLRDRCPISWWDIDMPPTDWAAEAQESLKRGHTSFKMKARPWRDIIEQVEAVEAVVPPDYKFDIDFNGFLLNQAKAEIILQQLDNYQNVGIFETPFWLWSDITGAKVLRERVRKPIVEHFNEACLHAHACDGFVIAGSPTGIQRQAALAASFNKPFWLQLVGTGITTAFAAHLGSVLSHAQLPYITTSELWEHDLLKTRLEVTDGYMLVPDGPGLGVEVDEEAIVRYTVGPDEPTGKASYREKKRILRVNWPGTGGKKRIWDFTVEEIYQRQFYQGNVPGFERGVSLEVIEDDGSAAFRKAHEDLESRGL